MAPALHVHLLGIRVIEPAVAQLAVEAERLAVVSSNLLDVVLPHRLHLGLGLAVGLLVFVLDLACGGALGSAHSAEPAGRHESDLGRAGDRLFGWQIGKVKFSLSGAWGEDARFWVGGPF